MRNVEDTSTELWMCVLNGSTARTKCTHGHRTVDRYIQLLFNTLLGHVNGTLPNVKFHVNHLDEPMSLIPPHTQSRGGFTLCDLSHQPTRNTITKHCSHTPQPKPDFALPFITDILSSIDLCQHPEYAQQHGLFMQPTSFRLFDGLMPILLTGSPSIMGDILFPSPAST